MSYKPIVKFACGCFGTRPATNGDTFLIWPCDKEVDERAFTFVSRRDVRWHETELHELNTIALGFANMAQANEDLTKIRNLLR